MATFSFAKSVNDIQEQERLPEDWYTMRLVKEPYKAPNKKKKEDETQEGAADNIVLDLRTVHENPDYNGRPFRRWLSLPGIGDTERIVNGMTLEDLKMTSIMDELEAYGIEIDGDTFELEAGGEVQYYVKTVPSFRDESKLVDEIDRNIKPRPVG